MAAQSPAREAHFLVLGRDRFTADVLTALRPREIRSEAALAECAESAGSETTWFALRPSLLRGLALPHTRRKLGNVLVLSPVSQAVMALLESRFSRVALAPANRDDQRTAFLPADQLVEVLSAPNRSDLFIGGDIDAEAGVVALIRGDLGTLVVPLASFEPSGDGTRPDFAAFSVTGYGQSVRFGPYEASSEAILYENDLEFRRRLKKQRRKQENSFGASLRRLRLQRGVLQGEFPGVTEKTIARLERNEVARPQKKTLAVIAKRLGVRVDQISEY